MGCDGPCWKVAAMGPTGPFGNPEANEDLDQLPCRWDTYTQIGEKGFCKVTWLSVRERDAIPGLSSMDPMVTMGQSPHLPTKRTHTHTHTYSLVSD